MLRAGSGLGRLSVRLLVRKDAVPVLVQDQPVQYHESKPHNNCEQRGASRTELLMLSFGRCLRCFWLRLHVRRDNLLL